MEAPHPAGRVSVRVGTSGWAYPEWSPALYPPGLARGGFLRHYATVFGTCEVNVTAHRLQSAAAVSAWADAVGPGFRFVCKVHKGITHAAGMPRTDLAARFIASLAPLGDGLATVLAQIPEERPRDDDFLGSLLDALAGGPTVVVETADPSWRHPGVDAVLAAHGAVRCLNHAEGPPPASLPAGPLAYVRMRADHYPAADVDRWQALLTREGEARDVYAICRHKDLPPDDPCAGLGLARRLASG